jgi:peptidoglycan/xylan/chitin deacetylase (PgdA/CDA1 family)
MIILVYHNVLLKRPSEFNALARPDWLLIKDFARQIQRLARRFSVVPLEEIVAAIRKGRAAHRTCAITFDDGYWGTYAYGLPVVESLGLSASICAITGYLREDGHDEFDRYDQLEGAVAVSRADTAYLADLGSSTFNLTSLDGRVSLLRAARKHVALLTPGQHAEFTTKLFDRLEVDTAALNRYLKCEAFQMMSLSELEDARSRGHAIGSHTRTHRTLSQLSELDLREEICGSRRDLGDSATIAPPFAYPIGKPEHYSQAAVQLVRAAGFSCGLTTIKGVNDEQVDPFQLRRVTYRDLKRVFDA